RQPCRPADRFVSIAATDLAAAAEAQARNNRWRVPFVPSWKGLPVERLFLWSAALAGFVGVGVEVGWTRLVSLVVYNTVYAFSQVLAAVLLGIALGGALPVIAARGSPPREELERRALYLAGLAQLLAAVLLGVVPSVVTAMAGDQQMSLAL